MYWQVIKPKLARPVRVAVTTCTWDYEGKCISGGIGDGSIQVNFLLYFFFRAYKSLLKTCTYSIKSKLKNRVYVSDVMFLQSDLEP